ncbi:MAG: tetratricopeptide repeat protein [Candidatus Marinimicrobia bacterium]|nr:tetratricopeptide repeat protein [Candidatus Neomarinimicrobiota bacterium]
MNFKKILVLILSIVSLISFSFAIDAEVLQKKVDEAQKLLKNFDAVAAQKLLDETLALDSTFASAIYTYHEIELMYGNLSDAQALVRQAIEFNTSEQSYRDKFDELRDLINQVKDAQREVDGGNYTTAKRIYNELIEKDPSIAEIYYRLGFVAVQEKDYDTARDNFDKASILAPGVEKYTKAKNILAGNIIQEAKKSISMNDLATAERKTLTSLRINPEFGYAYYILGYIKLKSGDITAAIENFEKAVKYDPGIHSAWYNLGSTYRRTKQYSKAEDALLHAIELEPKYAKAYTTLAQTYVAINKLKEAEKNFIKSIALDPNSAAARESYGELLNNQERYAEAIIHLTESAKLIQNPKKRYLTNYRLAYAYNRSNNYRKALDTAKEVTIVNTRFGGGWFELGVAYAKLGDKQNAINAFNKGRLDKAWRGIIDPERERLITGKDLSF